MVAPLRYRSSSSTSSSSSCWSWTSASPAVLLVWTVLALYSTRTAAEAATATAAAAAAVAASTHTATAPSASGSSGSSSNSNNNNNNNHHHHHHQHNNNNNGGGGGGGSRAASTTTTSSANSHHEHQQQQQQQRQQQHHEQQQQQQQQQRENNFQQEHSQRQQQQQDHSQQQQHHQQQHSQMNTKERLRLRDQVKEMFFHGYSSYMNNAFPADELMPLSCKGRFRGVEENRGDIDDALGNFSLTLVDAADTLVILNELDEFERAVKLIIENVRVDNDVVVSVFETNIRMLGGLLSSHILTKYLQETRGRMSWYNNELLSLAKELGLRLLPSFNSTTGIPHPRVNLRWGMKSPSMPKASETCTACAGTMLLELAALSRLTGEPIFEAKARRAMDYIWLQRHRSSDLVGTVINVNSGDWVRRDSGVGAGIDSYYEYCLKAYILLGEDSFLERFERHYAAVMKYISQGPMLVDVHMHRPTTNSKNFMDALLAFWPGLQVLKGDIKPAIETHEMLYQVMQRHNFLPEAFTTDFQVHWGQHPLRPEFIESTYFLYKATGDPYYLEVGRRVVESLQSLARVPCGFAAVKDVRTGTKDNRMDSFVLAETFKYLYLLFADKADVPINIDEFIFTTEAHLLPLSLSQRRASSGANAESNATGGPLMSSGASPTLGVTVLQSRHAADTAECPNSEVARNADKIRLPLKNLVEDTCPSQPVKYVFIQHLLNVANLAGHMTVGDILIHVCTLLMQHLWLWPSAISPSVPSTTGERRQLPNAVPHRDSWLDTIISADRHRYGRIHAIGLLVLLYTLIITLLNRRRSRLHGGRL